MLSVSAVTEKEDLGRGASVAVAASDARGGPEVCRREAGGPFRGVVTLAEDPSGTLSTAVGRGLVDKGFAVAAKAEGSVVRLVTVRLTELSAASQPAPGGIKAQAKAVLAVSVDNNGQVLERRFEAQTSWNLRGDNLEPDYDALLSQTLSKAVSRLASDYDIMNFLARTVLRTRDVS